MRIVLCGGGGVQSLRFPSSLTSTCRPNSTCRTIAPSPAAATGGEAGDAADEAGGAADAGVLGGGDTADVEEAEGGECEGCHDDLGK